MGYYLPTSVPSTTVDNMQKIREAACCRWVFTLNNYTEADVSSLPVVLSAEKFHFAIVSKEIAPTTGTPHLQGFVNLKTRVRSKTVQMLFPRASFQRAKGTDLHSDKYCNDSSKEGFVELVYRVGEPQSQGKRNDLDESCHVLREKGIDYLAETSPAMVVRYHRGFEYLLKTWNSAKKRDFKTQVIVLVGPPGVGKSRHAHDTDKAVYMKPDGEWFDGYANQPRVILDDFRGCVRYTTLLKIMDRYSLKVPVKGGFIEWAPEEIYITSNKHVWEWYKPEYDPSAIMRRINNYKVWCDLTNDFIELSTVPYVTQLKYNY